MRVSDSSDGRSRGGRLRRGGFTLLEMIVVVLLLSATAWAAVSLLDTNDSRFRFEDTQNRLSRIREGIIGDPSLRVGNQPVLSGFVADLGQLPASLDELGNDDVNPALPPFETDHPPVFDPTPTGGFNDGVDEYVFDGNGGRPEIILRKGYRGPYIQFRPGSTRFRDGWGNVGATVAEDNDDHGWDWDETTLANGLIITSVGANADIDTDEGGSEGNVDVEVEDMDWLVDVDGWVVTIENQSGGDFSSHDLGVAILVGRLNGVDLDWQQVFSGEIDMSTPIPDGDTRLATIPATSPIPIGEHLVVLFEDGGDGIVPNSGDNPLIRSGEAVTAKVRFFARRGLPTGVTLVIK